MQPESKSQLDIEEGYEKGNVEVSNKVVEGSDDLKPRETKGYARKVVQVDLLGHLLQNTPIQVRNRHCLSNSSASTQTRYLLFIGV